MRRPCRCRRSPAWERPGLRQPGPWTRRSRGSTSADRRQGPPGPRPPSAAGRERNASTDSSSLPFAMRHAQAPRSSLSYSDHSNNENQPPVPVRPSHTRERSDEIRRNTINKNARLFPAAHLLTNGLLSARSDLLDLRFALPEPELAAGLNEGLGIARRPSARRSRRRYPERRRPCPAAAWPSAL